MEATLVARAYTTIEKGFHKLFPFKTLRSLFSAAMIFLLFVFAIIGIILFLTVWESRLQEQLQLIHWSLAREIADEIEPILLQPDGVNVIKLYDAIERYQRVNQNMEVYLLDQNGEVVVDFSGTAVKRTVPTGLINEFVEDHDRHNVPHIGPDPQKSNETAPFVAATVKLDSGPGFIYVVLRNESLRAFNVLFLRDWSAFALVAYFAMVFTVISVLAYFVSWVVTSRFNAVTQALQRYQNGDLSARVQIAGDDELGRVAASINSMAESIQHNLEELVNKDSLRRELILNVWHDLRSPITSLRAHIELLELNEGRAEVGEKRLTYYRIAFRNIDQLSHLLTELHELARLETKDQVPEFGVVDMSALARELLLTFKSRPEAQDREVELETMELLPRVVCDPSMITRALVNLLENALRYTPAGGRVAIVLKRREGVVVEVRDTGMGIPSDSLPHVFERWYQVDPSTGRPAGSSGLGLAIVRKIVEAHGSSITVESREGEGTSFSFTLRAA